MEKHILSVLVRNNAGVLARISSLFGRRAFNIDSLTVSPTNDPRISRITMVAEGDQPTLEQIMKQVDKLEETIVFLQGVPDAAHRRQRRHPG